MDASGLITSTACGRRAVAEETTGGVQWRRGVGVVVGGEEVS